MTGPHGIGAGRLEHSNHDRRKGTMMLKKRIDCLVVMLILTAAGILLSC